jgi:hypothetical protein
MRNIRSLIILIAFCLNVSFCYASEPHKKYSLYFPKIDLSKENFEYIEEVHLSVDCGHIVTVTKIPDDWNIKIVRAISSVETFEASAGHGASRLSAIEVLNGAIQIIVGEKGCFKVSATILITGDNIRKVELPYTELILKP